MNESILVDTKKVAKQAKTAGEFMMFKCPSGNLLVTSQFILNLTEFQFFSIQCKLELPELESWWMQIKSHLVRSENRDPELEIWEARYNDWLNNTDPKKSLVYTRIVLDDCYLYTDGFTYTAALAGRIDMLQYSEDIRLSGRMLIIDGLHVVAPMNNKIWRNNNYLIHLPGMDREDENEK